jgi:phage protein U
MLTEFFLKYAVAVTVVFAGSPSFRVNVTLTIQTVSTKVGYCWEEWRVKERREQFKRYLGTGKQRKLQDKICPEYCSGKSEADPLSQCRRQRREEKKFLLIDVRTIWG